MARPKRKATCHPDRPHAAKGLCESCYTTSRKDPEKSKERMRKWRANNIEKVRASNIMRYGITLDDYKQMYASQNGKCAGCGCSIVDFGGDRNGQRNNAHIDHDHTTGYVRGLLCMQCNMILGAAQDSTVVLANLIAYLNQNEIGG